MVRATTSKVNRETLRTNVLGVRAAARLLGVNHGHLSRVLRGHRISASLMRRYKQLKGNQA